MRHSQNLPLSPRTYPLFNEFICADLPEIYAPPYQNIPPFSTTVCNPPSIYPSLPEYIPILNNWNIMRRSQNLPLSPKYTPPLQKLYATLPKSSPSSQNIPPFSTIMLLCDAPRINPSLPEYTPPFNNYMRHSQKLPTPPRIHPLV